MCLRATVAYDGTDFHGFQRQKNARSVQGVIEEALQLTCGEATGVVGAGRTDSGVHATGQVIAFKANWSHSLPELQSAMNARLPYDVSVLDLVECEDTFHPRYSARSRSYEYTVAIRPTRQPLLRLYTWQMERRLDVDAMNAAANVLIGEHDFAAFGTAPHGDVTVRHVLQAAWAPMDRICYMTGMMLRFTIEANAFLFRMVRRIVMALVRVGCGQLSVDNLRDILASKDSQRVKGMAPACGLNLAKVTY
jgi:tRNA pseudouridine38-40 synthase